MGKIWPEKKEKKRGLSVKEKEWLEFQKFVREQLIKLKEKGLSIPVATL